MNWIVPLILDLWIFAAAGLCLLSAAGFASRAWWAFDIASNFRLQYLALLAFSSLVFFLAGYWAAALICLLFALLNLAAVAPWNYFRKSPVPSGKTYRLLLANVWQLNQSYEKVRELIAKEQPDFVSLIEINQGWVDKLSLEQAGYRQSAARIQENCYGLVVYSRLECENNEVIFFSNPKIPSLIARFRLDGNILNLIATHPSPPKSKSKAVFRNQQLARLASYINTQPGCTVLCGDFNATTYSPFMKSLLQSSGLRDSRSGFGLQPSWPTNRPLLRIPIDHIFVSPEIAVHNRRLGPNTGSDHFPVILDFSFDSIV